MRTIFMLKVVRLKTSHTLKIVTKLIEIPIQKINDISKSTVNSKFKGYFHESASMLLPENRRGHLNDGRRPKEKHKWTHN